MTIERDKHGNVRRNNEERRQWILNDEGLYDWWQQTGKPMILFIQDNRMQIDECIDRMLNIEPRS